MDLKLDAGNVISAKVHEIGVLAVGSHLENHGTALPIDTDSKIASYVALQAALMSGAKFLGILYPATEYHFINHGNHIPAKKLALNHLLPALHSAKKCLDIKKVVLVNGHGGNVLILDYINEVEKKLEITLIFNNKIVEIEGAHAGTGELSMGSILKIADQSNLKSHCDLTNNPEVGMVGFKEAREIDKGINEGALSVENEGVCIDIELGNELLETAIKDVIKDIEKLLS